jgi:ATP-binding cassette, subfamily B (MDR/TAP), member 1
MLPLFKIFRTPSRTSRERSDGPSTSYGYQEPSSPKMAKSSSVQQTNGLLPFRHSDANHSTTASTNNDSSHGSPKVQSPPEKASDGDFSTDPSMERQDSFEMRLPELPKIDVTQPVKHKPSNGSEPESPISPLLTSDPVNERSHSATFSRPLDESINFDFSRRSSEQDLLKNLAPPSFWRLAVLSFAEWMYALLGSIGAAIFGSFNPLLAYMIALIVAAYYKIGVEDWHSDINKWCLSIAAMGVITVFANFLQHFYFGIMGEKMTERIRRMMFSGILGSFQS